MQKTINRAILSGQGFLLGLIAISAAVLTYLQTANFPFVPFTDAICFLPQAVKFAQGEGLRNVYQFDYLPDGAFIWHGFLFPLILGGLFKTDTYTKVSVVMAVMNAVTVLLLAAALLRLTGQWRLGPRAAFLAVCLLAQVGFLLGILGRPETLCSLLFACGLLVWTFTPSLLAYSSIGVIIGLLAVTSPLPAVCAGAFACLGIVARENRLSALVGIAAVTGAAALLTVAISFYFYPYSFGQWLWGMEQHAKSVITDPQSGANLNAFLRRFFISSGRFMMGPVLLSCWIGAAYLICCDRKHNKWVRAVLVTFLLLLGAALFRAGQFYYLLSVFPIAAGVAAAFLAIKRTLASLLLKVAILLSLGISSLDPLLLQTGRILGFVGMPLAEARRLYEQDMANMPGKIAVSMDLAVLSDRTERMQVLYGYVPPCDEPKTDWLVTQQFCYFYDTPPNYENFTLVNDRFVDKQKLPGRLSQWFGVNGYGYAVYRRKGTAD